MTTVDHGLPPECGKMLRDIVFCTHLDVFCRALLGYPPALVEPMTVGLQPGARAVQAKLRAPPSAKAAWLHDTMVAPVGLFTPRRVPPGVLNATGCFQATMGDVLDGYINKTCLVWVEHRGHRVIWVPAGADSLKKRLSVCVHPEGNGHCGFDATIAWLERHCVWDRGKTLPHLAITLWWLEYLRRASTASACALRPGRGVLPTTTKITCTQCSTWSQPNCATSTRRGCGLRR